MAEMAILIFFFLPYDLFIVIFCKIGSEIVFSMVHVLPFEIETFFF